MSDKKIRIMPNGVVINSVVDGPGLRTAIFTNFCAHRCPGCHNPETWHKKNGIDVGFEELYNMIEDKDITLTGGDPFFQSKVLSDFLVFYKQKRPSASVWAYSGFTYDEIVENPDRLSLLQQCDVLVDGRFVQELKKPGLKWKGSSNQRIIDVKESLKQKEVILWE